jgi:hypothetical protein
VRLQYKICVVGDHVFFYIFLARVVSILPIFVDTCLTYFCNICHLIVVISGFTSQRLG